MPKTEVILTHNVVGLGAEPRTMLGTTIVDWTTNTMLEHIYDRLLDRDAKTLKPKPMLATGWKVVNDTTWEFTLRPGVKFHNGEPFTAQAVKATIDYALDPASKSHYATSSYWKPVKEVQVVNDLTVRFTLSEPLVPLIAALTDRAGMMVSPKAAQAAADKFGANPVCSGPFKFVERVAQDRIVLERNPDYWDAANVRIDETGQRVFTVEELSKRFNVSTKTISRWRQQGLVSRRFISNGRKRVGFLDSSVEYFVNHNRDRVLRGEKFSQLTDLEKGEIVHRARRMARSGCCPSEITRRIASNMNRSVETMS